MITFLILSNSINIIEGSLVSIFYNYLFFFKSIVIIEKSNSANVMKFSKIMKSYIGSSNSSLHNVSNFLDS